MTTQDWDAWNYRQSDDFSGGQDLAGFKVVAADGDIGKVDKATNEVGASYVVVDTGPWILGKKVMLPAGVIRDVDFDDEKIFVNRTKEQIKNAPEFDEAHFRDSGYRDQLGGYYS